MERRQDITPSITLDCLPGNGINWKYLKMKLIEQTYTIKRVLVTINIVVMDSCNIHAIMQMDLDYSTCKLKEPILPGS